MKKTCLVVLPLWLTFVVPTIAESRRPWFYEGRRAVEVARQYEPVTGRAKNVIFFVGDGMGVSTVTAARILEGQLRGEPGEENLLSFERLPCTALIKTYNTDQQTSDSAGTMVAMVTGVKTRAGVISVNEDVTRGDHTAVPGRRLTTIVQLAARHGLATGLVTTTRVTHATPAACYAHSPERDWESDAQLSTAARADDFPDIARQLIEFNEGNGIDLVLGGGRANFIPEDVTDPEYSDIKGLRRDGRNLIDEWQRQPGSAYVWNRAGWDALDLSETRRLLALFEPSHMRYEHDRSADPAGEPSLSEMTDRAIDMLTRNEKGFFLMVEGGRIDHAHHETNAYRALTDTIEFARAVDVAMKKTSRKDTLIIVTADHSHVFTIAGYPSRGNPILGKVDRSGSGRPPLDEHGLPYTTLGYANGPGQHRQHAARVAMASPDSPPPVRRRPDLTGIDTAHPDFCQETTVPLRWETHGGEDVPLYADGPQAHLFRGVLEQHVIFHVMAEALGLASP